jgi:hypothetical protein
VRLPADATAELLASAGAAGSDENGLRVVGFWEPKAHVDPYEAEELFPVFQELGMMSAATDETEFTTFDADELYLRSR